MNTAVQLYDGSLSLITTPIPKLSNANDVAIQVKCCGVCGTDLHIIKGEFPAAKKLILGHEFAGVVSEVGEAVTHVKVGDRGQPQFCISEAMRTAFGYQKNGGMQKYCVVPAQLVHLIPSTMSLKQAVFCQPISTIVRGWDNMGFVESDAKILIAGAGIIGLLWASLFHFHGYRDVTISEPTDHRKQMASRMNLDYKCLHPDELAKEYENAKAVGDETYGFDLIVDCTGYPPAVECELKWLRKGATIVLFGVCPQGKIVHFEPYSVYAKEIKIVTSYLNRFTFPRTVKLVHDMSERYLKWEVLDVKAFQLQDYEAAFDALRKGSISKAVFEF
eukprot:gene12179-13436_t